MPTPDNIKEVENLAARGVTHQEIADVLGISIRVLYERKAEFQQFSQAFKKGRSPGIKAAASVIFDTMTKSKQEHLRLGTAQYFLDRRGGWDDKRAGVNLEVNVNGQLVSLDEQAREREERMQLIRLLTIEEREIYVDLLDRAAKRQKGEQVPVATSKLLPRPNVPGIEPFEEEEDGFNLNATAGVIRFTENADLLALRRAWPLRPLTL